ncbi:ubiquitin-specific protease ubp1 [Gnomoniopsis sp. IMI 355080]|nr:ubiquitin-specific protease ubp1 [Gnomoniopsis sp. IMI 355080]
MTSPTTNPPRRHDPFKSHPAYTTLHSEVTIWDRLLQPGVLVSVLVLLSTVAYQLALNRATARGRQLPTFAELLWDTIVYLVPARVLYAIDRWVNPPLFPIPMLQPPPATHQAKSDVLSRILRTDQPGSIVASMSQAGRRAYTKTFSFKGRSCQPAGLGNWDNSCFQNSVLQGLASLKHLPPYLATLTNLTPAQNNSTDEDTTTASALRAFIAKLNDASNNGKTLFTPGILKNMSTIQQQDAQEYFSRLLDQVDKDIEKGAKAACKPPGLDADLARDDSVASQHSDDSGYQSLPMLSKAGSELVTIRNPLEGLSAQRVACTACGYSEGLSMIPFNCLTLNFDVGVGDYDVYRLLDNYVQLESIQSVDCVKCTLLEYRRGLEHMAKAIPAAAERLQAVEQMLEEDEFDEEAFKKLKIPDAKKVSSTKTKQVAIARPPPSLVVHMNRSVFDPVTFSSYKNLAAVRFPSLLDIGAWCIGSSEGVDVQAESDMEHWVLDPTASMVAGDVQPSKISGPIYELRAVVTHYGRHENGHYVCYRKHSRNTVQAADVRKGDGDSPHPPNVAADEVSDDVDSIDGDPQPVDAIQAATDTEEPYREDAGSQWWRLSDETVIQVSEEDVLAQGGVFMLFYDCVDPNSVLITPDAILEAQNQSLASKPFPSGRSSPSRSEVSVATLCNAPADQEYDDSQVSLVAMSEEEHKRGAHDGSAKVLITELLENGKPLSEEEGLVVSEARATCTDNKPDRQEGAFEVSVSELSEDENESTAGDVPVEIAEEYGTAEQANIDIAEVSSDTISRRSSVTLAAEDDGAPSLIFGDKMTLDSSATQPEDIRV